MIYQVGDVIPPDLVVVDVRLGGMSVVYVVLSRSTSRVNALKTLPYESFHDATESQRFLRECRHWISLGRHPNIVQALSVIDVSGVPYLAMEFVAGSSLASWIGSPRLLDDLARTIKLAVHLCDGMSFAHKAGVVVHGDIKPSNCLVTEDDEVLRLTDFGLSQSVCRPPLTPRELALGEFLPKSHELQARVVGVPVYMAPELFNDRTCHSVGTDIYAFGVMLFEMCAGTLPFTASDLDELARLHETARLPPLPVGAQPLSSVLEKCLAKSRDDRYESFAALRADLLDLHERLFRVPVPLPARPPTDKVGGERLAWCLYRLGSHGEALEHVEAALEAEPTRPNALILKAELLIETRRDWPGALECLTRACHSRPQSEQVWYLLGGVLTAMGRYGKALSCVDQALTLAPRSAGAWNEKGNVLGAMNKRDEALECYEKAIVIRANDFVALNNAGEEHRLLGNYEVALSLFGRALSTNPLYGKTWTNKGAVLRLLDRLDEALACSKQATMIDSTDEKNWSNLALVLVEMGRTEEALEQLDVALELDKDFPEALHNKGAVLANSGRLSSARPLLERAAALGFEPSMRALRAMPEPEEG